MQMMDGQTGKTADYEDNIILKTPISGTHIIYAIFDHCDSIFYDIDVEERDLDVAPAYMYNLNQIALSPMLWCFIIRTYRKKLRRFQFNQIERKPQNS